MNGFLKRQLPIVIGLGMGVLCAFGFSGGVFESLSHRVSDRFFLDREADPRVVIVAIDDASLGRIGRWPWPRATHAQLIDRLNGGAAQVIAVDVNFPEPSDAASDQALADAIRRAGNVILPIELPLRFSQGALTFDPAGAVQPITVIQSAAKVVGHTNTPRDGDDVVRRVPLLVTAPDGSRIRSFAYEAAAQVLGATALPIMPTDRYGRLIVNYPGPPRRAFRTVSAADVIQGQTDPAIFKNAVVFIGATAHDLHDEQTVPTSRGLPMSGVEIHASLFDTIVSQHWLEPVPAWIQALLLIFVGLFLGFFVPRTRARVSGPILLALWFVWFVAAFIAFDRGWILDVVWPTILLVFTYVALVVERWADTEKRRRELRHAFSRYVSGSVVESIIKNPQNLKLGGERRRMSVLFSDLRGFTTLSEGLAPEKLVEVLNKYLHAMTEVVFEEMGVLDKYIGDAVMAFWNAPFDQSDHAVRAVRTAVRMRNTLAEMNRAGVFPDGVTLRVGIGVNTGEMVVGNIGGEMRYDYTVIGDSVNLASRTEGLNKEYGTEIIVTESTRGELNGIFATRLIDHVAVKGKKEPIRIYEVLGFAEDVGEAERKLVQDFEAAFRAYLHREFAQAIAFCEAILQVWPDDGPAKNLLERCQAYLACPPMMDWDGTWVMTKK